MDTLKKGLGLGLKLTKNRQKVIQNHWHLLYWIYHNEKY